jgi:hypothetical protein
MDAANVRELLVGLQRDHERGESPGLRLANACVELVSVGGAGIVLMDHLGNGSPLGLSDNATGVVEDLQFTLGEGPGIDAHSGGRPVLEPSLDDTVDARWPAFAPAAVDIGFLGAFGFPLRMGAVHLGALDLYEHRRGDLRREQLTDAISMAEIVTRAVVAVQAGADPGALGADLLEVDLRVQVHQAAGMISRQLDLPIADALVRLRAHAYAIGRSINEIALDVVERRLRFE